ncbi:MAG: substrate-binding domain-containing protein [Oscillospiraceae bacterium]|nr:substrate-binding domain-containing protein [Oscillospiraceae bacterium]
MRNNKFIIAILILALTATLLAGCENKPQTTTEAPVQTTGQTQPQTTEKTEPTTTDAPVITTAEPTDAVTEFRFTRENFPRLDGSTACLPMAEAICSVLLGESRESVQDLINFNRTTQAFRNLKDGNCDLIVAGEPNAAVFQEMDDAKFGYDIEQIATDALVFLVNENNPVDNITTKQLRDIYSGKITNWKELGGEDAEIVPLQRNEGAGSQALMKKLVMKDTPLMEAPAEYYPGSMGDLMEAVKSYDASGNAIGYSVYYYAHDMEMATGLKLLKVDGVEPNRDTIASEQYPHRNAYYCVIAKAAKDGSPTRILFDWLMTEDGQALLAAEGYVTNK